MATAKAAADSGIAAPVRATTARTRTHLKDASGRYIGEILRAEDAQAIAAALNANAAPADARPRAGDPHARHAPSVCRAARDGFVHASGAMRLGGAQDSYDVAGLGAMRGVARGWLRASQRGTPHHMSLEEGAAYVLGAWAAAAVLRVRAERARRAAVKAATE